MNAMLDPSIAAARIHGSALFAHGLAVSVDSMTAWSHGGFIKIK